MSGVTPFVDFFVCYGLDLAVQRLLTAWLGPVWSVAMIGRTVVSVWFAGLQMLFWLHLCLVYIYAGKM